MDDRFDHIPGRGNRGGDLLTTVLFVLFILTGLGVLSWGIALVWQEGGPTLPEALSVVVVGVGVLAVGVPVAVYALIDRAGGGGDGGGGGGGSDIADALREQNELLRSLNDRVLISDQAKRIAYRQRDREALRDAIVSDIRGEDYEAAAALIEEMSETYGYREEAEQFRQQLIEVQTQRREVLLTKAVKRIDDICERHDWEAARHEVARLKRLYPDHPRVIELPKRVEASRDKHKNDLEREFLQAAERDDIERAMELLRELDMYLTPEEAAHYMETARGVVGKKRQNLGVQFKMAAHDRDWMTALRVGEQIIKEFPNSRFAQEVRSMIDVLRERATAQRAAASQEQSA